MNHIIYSLIGDSANTHKTPYRQQYQEHEKEVVGRLSQLHRHNNTDYITDEKYGVRTGAQTR